MAALSASMKARSFADGSVNARNRKMPWGARFHGSPSSANRISTPLVPAATRMRHHLGRCEWRPIAAAAVGAQGAHNGSGGEGRQRPGRHSPPPDDRGPDSRYSAGARDRPGHSRVINRPAVARPAGSARAWLPDRAGSSASAGPARRGWSAHPSWSWPPSRRCGNPAEPQSPGFADAASPGDR
jgi:hypothetical protein